MSLVIRSYALKYSFIGGFWNEDKFYLMKEILIISMVLVACIRINTITLWPVAIAVFVALLMMSLMEIFGVPARFKYTLKVKECPNRVEAESGEILAHDRINNHNIAKNEAKKEQPEE